MPINYAYNIQSVGGLLLGSPAYVSVDAGAEGPSVIEQESGGLSGYCHCGEKIPPIGLSCPWLYGHMPVCWVYMPPSQQFGRTERYPFYDMWWPCCKMNSSSLWLSSAYERYLHGSSYTCDYLTEYNHLNDMCYWTIQPFPLPFDRYFERCWWRSPWLICESDYSGSSTLMWAIEVGVVPGGDYTCPDALFPNKPWHWYLNVLQCEYRPDESPWYYEYYAQRIYNFRRDGVDVEGGESEWLPALASFGGEPFITRFENPTPKQAGSTDPTILWTPPYCYQSDPGGYTASIANGYGVYTDYPLTWQGVGNPCEWRWSGASTIILKYDLRGFWSLSDSGGLWDLIRWDDWVLDGDNVFARLSAYAYISPGV